MYEFKFYKSYNLIIKRKVRMLVLWLDWKGWKLFVKGLICMWGKNWVLDLIVCRKSMWKFGLEFNISYVFFFLGGWENISFFKDVKWNLGYYVKVLICDIYIF